MRGEYVIVRAYNDRPFLRRVWEFNKSIVFITDDSQYGLLEAGEKALEPLGCPRKDVFKHNPKLTPVMEKLFLTGKWDWNKLIPY